MEDQSLIAKSIVKTIESSGLPLRVVAIASNGEQALALLQAQTVDILITDIRMPVMDGLELIGRCRDLGYRCKCIIVSGFSEFSYAQQAIQLGVDDYILKPLTYEKISTTLQKVVRALLDEKQTKTLVLLERALEGELPSPPPSFAQSGFAQAIVVSFCFNTIPDAAGQTYSPQASKNIERLLDYFRQHLPDAAQCFFLRNTLPVEHIGVVCGTGLERSLLMEQVQGACRCGGLHCTVVVGACISALEELRNEVLINRAMAKKYALYASTNLLLRTDSASLSENFLPLPPNFENDLAFYVKGVNLERLFAILQKLCGYCRQNNCTIQNLMILVQQMLELVMTAAQQPIDPLFLRDEAERIVLSTSGYPQLESELRDTISAALSSIDSSAGNTASLMLRVEKRIKEAFTTPLNINELAQEISISPAYLSRLFKAQYGVSPTEYIANLRLQYAQQLIETNSSLSFKDISQMAGFFDQYYFSKAFKQKFGVSPRDYRKKR